ncbi:MAG TPA: hypothetical protein DCS63_06080 [Elusimicrobia bacterium]|nr:hypothetical protein [Elusimicrobiota bacterium]
MKQITVLIVEDDKLNRELVSTALREDGYMVHTAASIGDCRDILKRDKPDIIVLDRGLPDGDGFQLCVELKKDPLFRAISVIMLTGDVVIREKLPGLRCGANDYLAKPYDIDELRSRVGALAKKF